MKLIIRFIGNLFVVFFGKKNAAVSPSIHPTVLLHNEVTTPVTTVDLPFVSEPKVPTVEPVKLIKQPRPRLSAIVEMMVLQEVPATIVSKHRAVVDNQDVKILGQIGGNGFARIRRFGAADGEVKMVRLAIQ